METLFDSLYYGIGLKATGLAVGAALIAAHVFAIIRADLVKGWLTRFPRDTKAGIVLLSVALAWSFLYMAYMDLGEFFVYRKRFLVLLPIAFFLVIKFVEEFLSVRALGALLLLLACPVLNAAFLQPPASRILLPALAYVWIFLGLFWIGMPYLLRDQVRWLSAKQARWTGACVAGIAYGTLLLGCSILFY